jgi:hypothetical protein
MRRHESLDYRRSLARLMEHGDPSEREDIARRQERTVDALLDRMYTDDEDLRREMVLLADEVGLGKTFVALGVAWSVLLERMRVGLPVKPILVVTPTSRALFAKWQRDTETFLNEVVPQEPSVAVLTAETPHDLVDALCVRKPAIVIARMSAFQGQLYEFKTAMAATLHSLFSDESRRLSVDQRLALVKGCSVFSERDEVDLRGSSHYWAEAEGNERVGFGQRHVVRAMRRLQRIDSSVMKSIDKSIEKVSRGDTPRTDFQSSVRELARAALGERIPGTLPLVVVDEIHNWKNWPQSWQRFQNMLGGRIERMLGLSATPFQLDPGELLSVLGLRRCLRLEPARVQLLDSAADLLEAKLGTAQQAGSRLAEAWSEVRAEDCADIEHAWNERASGPPDGMPSRIGNALAAAVAVESAHNGLTASLRPFLVRHRRNNRHRRWRVGCDADAPLHDAYRSTRSLAWRPGLDVRGDGELVHYLMMRATQESKHGKGATSLGSDLGGSYDFFREHELKRLQQQGEVSARPYLDLVELATGQTASDSHPKVRVTVERAFNAWLHGEKTLVFCFNPLTVDALRNAIAERIHRHERSILVAAFGCAEGDYENRLANFQKRLYDYRQSLFLLLQDHPLAGCEPGRQVPGYLALTSDDFAQIARKLAAGGPPAHRSRFDRRRILTAAEQVLVARWQQTDVGRAWLAKVIEGTSAERDEAIRKILSPDWPSLRRSEVEGMQRDGEAEPFPDDEGHAAGSTEIDPARQAAWREILSGKAGRAVLAPYLADTVEVPSLLLRWHADKLDGFPASLRALATRMLRRMVRSPGFLARFLLNDIETGSALDDGDDEQDGQWTTRLHDRWCTTPTRGESARDRFNAYLETLRKVLHHKSGTEAYEEAARNRDTVARVTGAVSSTERDRFFTGFNTPLVPEVLIVTSVGQEGIDLHRECRHVIHHDLPWNPATLEQRTGRVDRIGSKAERLAGADEEAGVLDVVVPYLANTYDEFRFRRVHARAHLFEVTMGAHYEVDTNSQAGEAAEDNPVVDDADSSASSTPIEAVVPLPDEIAQALRMRLEAEDNAHWQEHTSV